MLRHSRLLIWSALWSVTLPGVAVALQIRSYSAARHDRFTGFPASPVVNGSSWFTGANYTGVGWSTTDLNRQFALISPSHVITANHYPLTIGSQIRFVSNTGSLVTVTVTATTNVMKAGQPTDLMVAKVSPSLTGSGVSPLPYLNLPQQSQYETTVQEIFGFNGTGGNHPVVASGVIAGFDDFSFFGTTTRMSYFFHLDSAGSGDDCYFTVGDSGSPSFAQTRSGPALIGTHSLVGDEPGIHYSLDSHLPEYVGEINTILALASEQMTPVFADPTPLGLTGATTPDPMRQLEAGTATFTLENQGLNDALSPEVTLEFPGGAAPNSVTVSGWTTVANGPTVWTFQRGSMDPAETASVVATWSSVPVVTSLPVTITHQSDASPRQRASYDLEPAPSYAAWSQGLAQPGVDQDPDGDGRKNLLEYAFGSSATSGSMQLSSTVLAGPVLVVASGSADLRFPVRVDSEVRGLQYSVEFSDDLQSWTQPEPMGTTYGFSAYVPAITGFTQRTCTFPATAVRKFVRVRVVLDENAPGLVVP